MRYRIIRLFHEDGGEYFIESHGDIEYDGGGVAFLRNLPQAIRAKQRLIQLDKEKHIKERNEG